MRIGRYSVKRLCPHRGGLTLQEVLGLAGGGEQALARQAVAALININSERYRRLPDDPS